MENGKTALENSVTVYFEGKIQLPYDPAIPFLEVKWTHTYRDAPAHTHTHTTCMWMFTAALFMTAES